MRHDWLSEERVYPKEQAIHWLELQEMQLEVQPVHDCLSEERVDPLEQVIHWLELQDWQLEVQFLHVAVVLS
jgi:hypothetical protein